MNKLKINLPNKTQEIGDSLNRINRAFQLLKSYTRNLQDVKEQGEGLVDSIRLWFDDLTYCLNFMNRNNQKYLNLFEEVLNKRETLIKPLVLIYPSKIRSDVGAYSTRYIQNVIHDWITKHYPIKSRSVEKPNYVEGQKAIVYFLRNEEVSLVRTTNDRDAAICVTANTTVTVRCTSTRTGQVCINGCGCISCAGSTACHTSGVINCFFPDGGIQRKRVSRYLALDMRYNYQDYPETKFGFVRYIVDNCEWKIDNTIPITSPTPSPEPIIQGIVTFKNKQQIKTFDKLDVDPF